MHCYCCGSRFTKNSDLTHLNKFKLKKFLLSDRPPPTTYRTYEWIKFEFAICFDFSIYKIWVYSIETLHVLKRNASKTIRSNITSIRLQLPKVKNRYNTKIGKEVITYVLYVLRLVCAEHYSEPTFEKQIFDQIINGFIEQKIGRGI